MFRGFPSSGTDTSFWVRVTLVAFFVVHDSVTVPFCSMLLGVTLKLAVGFTGPLLVPPPSLPLLPLLLLLMPRQPARTAIRRHNNAPTTTRRTTAPLIAATPSLCRSDGSRSSQVASSSTAPFQAWIQQRSGDVIRAAEFRSLDGRLGSRSSEALPGFLLV